MILGILLFSIPEAVAVTWLVYALSCDKIVWPKLLAIGCFTGIAVSLVRPSIPYFIINMSVYAVVLIVLLILLKVTSTWKAIISVGIALPIYLLTEFLSITVLTNFIQVQFMDVTYIKFLFFLPQLFITIFIALVFSKEKYNLFIDKDLEV